MHWKFKARQRIENDELFVATIPYGRVWSEGYVISPDNLFLADASRVLDRNEHDRDALRHPIFHQGSLPPVERIEGRVAVVATCSGRGFYHWMFDVLPRIELLRRSSIAFSSIDHFVVNDCVAPFHFATLEKLGIDRKKLLQCQWHPHVEAAELIVPSHAGALATTPRWACDFLRKALRPAGLPNSGARTKLYVTRSKNAHRRIPNEAALIEALTTRGFEVIDPEFISQEKQVERFSQATIVMGVHGSGLANTVYCEPGTKVIEIFHPAAISLMYWSLCEEMGLEYYYVLGAGESPAEGHDPHLNAEDIVIDLAAVEKTLALAGIR